MPYTIKMRVRVDSYGNSIGDPEPADPEWRAWIKAMETKGLPTLEKADESTESNKSVLEKPQYDKSSIFYTDPSFEPLDAPKTKAADQVPSLKETSAVSKSVLSKVDSSTEKNRVNKPLVKDNRVRSILVPETEQDFEPTTTMKQLGGQSIQIETDARKNVTVIPMSVKSPTPARNQGNVEVTKNKFVAPVKTKTETSLKPAWKMFDPELIKRPAAPSASPALNRTDAISIPGIDRVDELKRKPVNEIY